MTTQASAPVWAQMSLDVELGTEHVAVVGEMVTLKRLDFAEDAGAAGDPLVIVGGDLWEVDEARALRDELSAALLLLET